MKKKRTALHFENMFLINKKIMLWDKSLNEAKLVNTWFNEVKSIFSDCNLLSVFETGVRFNKQEILSNKRSTLLVKQRCLLEQECKEKTKLRTFLLFKDFKDEPAYIGKPLSFHQRRILAKTRLGCLPLRIETGRYSRPRLREDERVCLACKPDTLIDTNDSDMQQPVESEVHFMFSCAAYRGERDHWYSRMEKPENFENLSVGDKLKIALNSGPNVKLTSQFLLSAFDKRSLLLK